MNWYEGGIAEAVRISKLKGAIFVVYVEGKDEMSQQLAKLINDEQVAEQLKGEHFVAIKLINNSVPLEQFRQIYKQVSVPSIFFIGKNGSPLEIITGPLSVSDFLDKLNQILLKHGINIASNDKAAKHTDDFIKNEKEEIKKDYEVVCENDVCTLQRKETPTTSKEPDKEVVDEASNLTPEEKLERAKELVNKTREAKRAEEEAKERLKEIERRKLGQDVQKLKRWQQDNDLKELVEERNKEKKEQQAARQRVLEQIAQDKAERAAKFANTSGTSQTPTSSGIATTTQRTPVNNDIARLQFRLPDGSSHTQEFPSSNTLQDVRNFILTNITLPFNNYTLSTTFPRREFTFDENSKTLLELELTPNAVILILPIHGVVAANTNSWLLTFVWSFIGPVLNFLGYLKQKITGGTSTASSISPSTSRERKRATDNVPETSSVPKKRFGETTVIRRQGNVHRLADKADSDDENNTWNGNSTQQM